MGLRFRKYISIIPGIRLNLSKSGVSASLGKPGATLNFSSRGTRATVGLPGTGVSYSEASRPGQAGSRWVLWLVLALLAVGYFWGR